MAIPKLAEEVGISPRVLRYWEEQGLISPSFEHGRLRYSPRDLALARLVRMVMERTGISVDGIRVLKRLAEREVRQAGADENVLAEVALRLLYARKAFREVAGVDEERLGAPHPPKPPPRPHPKGPKHGPKHGPRGPRDGPRHGPGPDEDRRPDDLESEDGSEEDGQ